MPIKRLPRDLAFRINHLANERATRTTRTIYRATYLKEKARILGKVVIWMAAGKTVEEITEKLRDRRREAIQEKIKTAEAMLKQIMKMP